MTEWVKGQRILLTAPVRFFILYRLMRPESEGFGDNRYRLANYKGSQMAMNWNRNNAYT